jgi:hypothetical protein
VNAREGALLSLFLEPFPREEREREKNQESKEGGIERKRGVNFENKTGKISLSHFFSSSCLLFFLFFSPLLSLLFSAEERETERRESVLPLSRGLESVRLS